jgi:hypothetical protein
MRKYKIKLLCIFILLIIFLIYVLYESIETFSNIIPKTDPVGDFNDTRWISLYKPQNSIFTSNIQQYYKNEPVAKGSDFEQDIPPPVHESDIQLPATSEFGSNSYRKGLFDYRKILKLINDNISILNKEGPFDKTLIHPITKQPLEQPYEVQFELDMLNKKTWNDRWKEYNPMEKISYSYDEIKSPIQEINQLNLEFMKRMNEKQEVLLDKRQLVMFGVIPFEIFKYQILKIEYHNPSLLALYTIQIVLFRESDLYLSTLTFRGFVLNGKPYIFESMYVGGKTQDTYLIPNGYEKEKNYQILNKNYTNQDNTKILELNPDAIVKQVKDYQEGYKMNNQYACFNTNPEVYLNPEQSDNYIIRGNFSNQNNAYPTREKCESYYDWYGRLKDIGVLDRPCKKDEDCPYYSSNKNYKNEFGKCGKDGQCELPINMKPLGFRYFSPSTQYKPMCYNCKSDEWNISTPLDMCCDEQFDKKKYPFLNGPDYAYANDYTERYNHFISKKCHINSKGNLVC